MNEKNRNSGNVNSESRNSGNVNNESRNSGNVNSEYNNKGKALINNFVNPNTPDQNDIINNNHGESATEYDAFVCEEIERVRKEEK